MIATPSLQFPCHVRVSIPELNSRNTFLHRTCSSGKYSYYGLEIYFVFMLLGPKPRLSSKGTFTLSYVLWVAGSQGPDITASLNIDSWIGSTCFMVHVCIAVRVPGTILISECGISYYGGSWRVVLFSRSCAKDVCITARRFHISMSCVIFSTARCFRKGCCWCVGLLVAGYRNSRNHLWTFIRVACAINSPSLLRLLSSRSGIDIRANIK